MMRHARPELAAACALLTVAIAFSAVQAQAPASGPASAPTSATSSAPATAPVSRIDYPAGSPANWLGHEGKSDAWYTATLKCRALLARLNLADERTKRWQPRIQDKCQVLRRVSGFNWKTVTAVEFLEGILEDLLAGKEPLLRYAGKEFAYPYWSATMRMIQANWIHVPPGYDPAKSFQLFLYYKCGGGIYFKDGKAGGGFRPTAEVANQTDTFHAWSSLNIQIKGRMGGEIELEEFPQAISQDFSVSPDRVFLTGWSDGGFTAIWLGTHFPHLVAGIAPNCGNWQYGNTQDIGLWNVPMLAVDGWSDGGYNNLQFYRWQTLAGMGAPAEGVWGHHGHSYQPYEDVEEFTYILDWAKGKKRDLWPKRVRYATWNLSWNRAYWVRIQRVVEPWLAAQIDAEVKDGNRLEVKTWNIAEYRLTLGDKLVDKAKPVTVMTDGKQSYAGPYKDELVIELVKPPAAKFVKTADMPDEITAVTVGCSYDTKGYLGIPGRTWISVKPSSLDEATGKLLAKWFPAEAKVDTGVNAADIAGQNLFLYGGPEVNALTAKLAADLPVKFEKGKFTIGGQTYDQPTNCLAMIHPNPLNPKKYVILYAFNDAAAFAKNGFFGMRGESGTRFRSGDCVISGITAPATRFGAGSAGFQQRHMILDAGWRTDGHKPLGNLEKPLDDQQIMRLRADAIREAAGADVGIIWSHTPGWNRWGSGLPAGPVTQEMIATVDMLPEYVTVGEMSGAALAKQSPSAWTVVAQGAPEGEGVLPLSKIEPQKTYKIATGYFGFPSYGANTAKMPKLFKFAKPEDWKTDNTSLPIANVRTLPVEINQAVGEYIRKRGKLSPRPVDGNLIEYVMNPRDNMYSKYDWLHVAFDAAWQRPGAGGTGAERFNVAVGIAPADESAGAAGGKELIDVAGNWSRTFDFGKLPRKLPVSVSIRRRELAMAADGATTKPVAADDKSANVRGAALELVIESRHDKELAATIVLNGPDVKSIEPQVWPTDAKDKTPFGGFHRSFGQYRQPATRTELVLLPVVDGAKPQRLVLPNAGFNFGLFGFSLTVKLKPGQTVVPVTLLAVDHPKGRPANVSSILETRP